MNYYAEQFPWDIALIDPDGFSAAASRRRPGTRLFPHMGLGYLAAALEQNKDRVAVLDAGVSTHREVQRFLSHPANLTGITATSFTFHDATAAARAVKVRYPATLVILGGPHASIDPQGCLSDPAVDFALRGEGEHALVDLVEVFKRQPKPDTTVLASVPGLIFRTAGGIRVNPPAERLTELDQLPYPAWHLFPMRRYRQHPLLSSRGCPMDCAFCAVRTLWGRRWVRRDPVQVVQEMAWLQAHWGRKLFHINDDNLTMDPEHCQAFCHEIQRRRLKVDWVAQGVRADGLTAELARSMRRAGCHRVSLGIESADPAVLEAVGKQERPEDMARSIAICHAAGIQVLGMFMVGNPQDTAESVRASIRAAADWEIDLPAFYMALPYPGTRLWDYAKNQGHFISQDYLAFDHLSQEPVFETPEFSADERRHVYAEAERFCQKRLLLYHLKYWFPGRLVQRNGFEIRQELAILARALLRPWSALRRLSGKWTVGGVK